MSSARPRIAAVAILVTVTTGGAALTLSRSDRISRPSSSARGSTVRPAIKPILDTRATPALVAEPAAPAAYTVKRVLPIDGPLRYGEWHWDESDAPSGPIVITVDLAARVLSVFRDGYEIGTTAVIYGADEKPTPLGVFPITQKDADHRSSIYGGAPMPYMLRLTNDGVSIHGSDVRPEFMTHGCVGVPVAFARKLFAKAKLGDKVVITNGEVLKLGEPITAARAST